MRIGIYLGNLSPEWGGAFTFEKSIFDALGKLPQRQHDFYLFYFGAPPSLSAQSHIHFVPLKSHPQYSVSPALHGRMINKLGKLFGFQNLSSELNQIRTDIDDLNFKRNSKNSLNEALIENHIDLIWFPSMNIVPVQIPFVVTLWDLGHRQLPVFPELSISGSTWEEREKAYQAFLRRAVKVFIGTESARKELSFFYNIPLEFIHVAPMPLPDYLLETSEQKNSKFEQIRNPFLFYPAQFWPHKNHIVCLLTLKILKEQYGKTFDLVLTGSDKGNLEFIRKKAKELEVENQIHFPGFVSSESLVWLYKNAFALLFPTFLGPDNIPPLEAFALGCPVIASNVTGAIEQMGDAAILIDPRREDLFAEAIAELTEGRRQTLIEKGKTQIKNRTSQHYLHIFLSAIKEVEPYRRCWSNAQLWQHL